MKLGFIGTGNMASAIMGGIIKNQIIPANDIIGADVMEAGRERVKEQFKIQVTADNHEVINRSDIVILSVKPQFYAEVIAEIKDDVHESGYAYGWLCCSDRMRQLHLFRTSE